MAKAWGGYILGKVFRLVVDIIITSHGNHKHVETAIHDNIRQLGQQLSQCIVSLLLTIMMLLHIDNKAQLQDRDNGWWA